MAVQIGDGDLHATSEDNSSLRCPLPEDPECVGNITTSICDRDAFGNMRTFCSRKLPNSVFVATDGFCFNNNEDREKLFSIYAKEYSANPSVNGKNVSESVRDVGYRGSCDDISFAMILAND